MTQPRPADVIDLTGQVERVSYHDEHSGFTIALVQIPGRRQMVTVVGDLMAPAPGTVLEMRGYWTEHPAFGPQFKADQ